MTEQKSIFRLRNKHSKDLGRPAPTIDAQALVNDQSLQNALLGGLGALLLLNALWIYTALLFDRFFPLGSVVQGVFIGLAVRRFGRGLNWRFPVVAATLAVVGAVTGSFFAALNLTAREFSMDALPLMTETSWHTIETFFVKNFGVVGVIYAAAAAILAAFYAHRRLDRYEAQALRGLKEGGGL